MIFPPVIVKVDKLLYDAVGSLYNLIPYSPPFTVPPVIVHATAVSKLSLLNVLRNTAFPFEPVASIKPPLMLSSVALRFSSIATLALFEATALARTVPFNTFIFPADEVIAYVVLFDTL